MKYLCTNCSYVYDEGLGEISDDIQAGTRVDAITYCPNCDEEDSFHQIQEEINYIENEDLPNAIELDHVAVFNLNNGTLEVKVGRESHPMGENHRITSISFFDEYGDIIEEKFLDMDEECVVKFDVSDFDEGEIRISCSQHGIWGRKINFEN